jgi:pimeloyl-ACP methyl ester carboxylesterase
LINANAPRNPGSQDEKQTLVLVHGGWCGGWLWRDVAPALRKQGHAVTTPTLSGLGERRHLATPAIDLSVHIEDIVAHIELEGFQSVTLIAQSYGGMVATGVVTRIPEKIRSVVYLDAFVPEDGQSLSDILPSERRGLYLTCRDENRPIPPLPLSFFGITDPALVEFMTPRLVPQPWRTFFEPVKVAPRPAHIVVSYVRCTANSSVYFDRIANRLADEGARMATIDTTHLCMLTAPEATVKAILD